MAQDTNIENLIINKLTKAQYESIANPDPTQLYFITDEVISSSDVVNALGYTPENVANKTTTLSSSSTDTQYPSAKAVYDQIANIDTLPSQTGQFGKFLTTDGTNASWGNLHVATASTVGVVKPDNASIRVDNDGTLSAICRNVGEIITSTLPLTDAGLHLLDGSLLQYGIYQEFIDYIADLYAENPTANYFTDETTWQASITQYGSCGKFVYDSVNKTVRLPKVSDILQGTTDLTLYYIVIANSTKTDIQVDIDEIATDLNGKADVDLTNVNNSGTSRGAGWAMPSDKSIDLTLGASGTQYTAPANGWVKTQGVLTANNAGIILRNITTGFGWQIEQTTSGWHPQLILPVSKGDIFTVETWGNITIQVVTFFYAQGSESEAQ